MFDVLLARWKQGHRTIRYPAGPPPELPERFAGRPTLDRRKCDATCRSCVEVCPTGAVVIGENGQEIRLDMGRCLFCRACETACRAGAISFSRDFQLSEFRRDHLILKASSSAGQSACGCACHEAPIPRDAIRRLFGRSLKLRQVSAGGCNACEADTNVLETLAWDLGRFGIQFVASPRHADGLLITGPVTENMRSALRDTYDAVPGPKLVIAVGACAIAGGPYIDHPEVHNGADSILPVDLYVPGCPPHPLTILHALLAFLDKLPTKNALNCQRAIVKLRLSCQCRGLAGCGFVSVGGNVDRRWQCYELSGAAGITVGMVNAVNRSEDRFQGKNG